jgi:hypothetical protein
MCEAVRCRDATTSSFFQTLMKSLTIFVLTQRHSISELTVWHAWKNYSDAVPLRNRVRPDIRL